MVQSTDVDDAAVTVAGICETISFNIAVDVLLDAFDPISKIRVNKYDN
jgi:hypothetical protein